MKCLIHYKGQEYWAIALCDECNAYLETYYENGDSKTKEISKSNSRKCNSR